MTVPASHIDDERNNHARTLRGEGLSDPRQAPAPSVNAHIRLDLTSEILDVLVAAVTPKVAEALSDMDQAWIGVEGAAAYLACPRSRIYRLVSQGCIPFEKDGARLLFRRADLDAWVARGGAGR